MNALKWILYRILFVNLPDIGKLHKFNRQLRYWAIKNNLQQCGKDVHIEHGACFSKDLKIGNRSGIGANCKLGRNVTIGNDVMMGPDCLIYTRNHTHDRIDIPMIEQGYTEKNVTIEDDVWIGARCILLPGVRVAKGAVVAAGAVVTKDVPSYAVVGGVPAKVLKFRNSKE